MLKLEGELRASAPGGAAARGRPLKQRLRARQDAPAPPQDAPALAPGLTPHPYGEGAPASGAKGLGLAPGAPAAAAELICPGVQIAGARAGVRGARGARRGPPQAPAPALKAPESPEASPKALPETPETCEPPEGEEAPGEKKEEAPMPDARRLALTPEALEDLLGPLASPWWQQGRKVPASAAPWWQPGVGASPAASPAPAQDLDAAAAARDFYGNGDDLPSAPAGVRGTKIGRSLGARR